MGNPFRSFAVVILMATACGRNAPTRDAVADAAEPREAASAPRPREDAGGETEASAALTPLPLQPPFAELPVPTFPDAVVSLPNGATSPRPVLAVLHAAGEQPEQTCDMWRQITLARGFVVCPRDQDDIDPSAWGRKGYARRGGVSLRSFISVVFDALAARYGAYVDGQHPLVVGSSVVASEVARLAADDPRRFPRIALLEGGSDAWTKERIHAFHWDGGDRVLFGCLSQGCMSGARAAASHLDKAGVESRTVRADAKRTNDDAMRAAVTTEMEWFLGDDSRWAGARP